MSLIQCPECQGNVSDKAGACPHCGYPLQSVSTAVSVPVKRLGRPKNPQSLRLPNGYGTIKMLSGDRRKPYAAMVNPKLSLNETSGKGYYTYDYLGSFEKKSDAYMAIMKYNENPYNLNNDMTIKELFEKWLPKYLHDNGFDDARRRAYELTFEYCHPAYKIKVREFIPTIIEEQIENAYRIGNRGRFKGKRMEATLLVKNNIKSLYNLMFDYAVFLQIVTENYARTFTKGYVTSQSNMSREGIPYTKDELDKLWSLDGDSIFVDMTLVQCYSGWRPGEVLSILIENVDLKGRTFTGGVKTESGINRTIPIHSKIYHIVEKYYKEAVTTGRELLFGRTEKYHGFFSYSRNSYRHGLLREEEKLGITGHVPHDGRHTFSTLAKKYDMNEFARKKLMGHAIKDLTDRVYTHMDMEWFKNEIEKIK